MGLSKLLQGDTGGQFVQTASGAVETRTAAGLTLGVASTQ